MKITLNGGKVMLIDKKDWDKVKHKTWGAGRGGGQYVGTNGNVGHSNLLHRFIMNTPKGLHTDHINGNQLDNRRRNLRICTSQQNQANSSKHIVGSSKYKGVNFYKRDKCWRAYINKDGVQFHLGYFDNELEAAKAYNKKAKVIWGKYARLNTV